MAHKRNYMFTNKNQSKKAIMSTALGFISLAAIVLSIYLSFLAKGDALLQYGTSLFLALLFSIAGIVLAILAIRERENYRIFPFVGLILNGMVIIFISLILFAGAYGI